MNPVQRYSRSWIDDGEKYAVIALGVKLDDPVPLQEITRHHWAFADARFDMPAHWREWLGTSRTEEVEDSNLFLLSKMRSHVPEIVDAETAELRWHAGHFYAGLLLASPFAPAHRPVILTGYRQNGEINVRSQDEYAPAIPSMVRHYPPVTFAELQLAATIASQIAAIETTSLAGGRWRLSRVLHLYLEARTIQDNMDRLHQYCGCIDGLIVPDIGNTKRQFKSRTELFIGPRHHDMTYDVRSDVEHLHENKHLEVFDRTARLELVKKVEMTEYIARSALVRIALEPKLWPHFANTPALQAFLGARQPAAACAVGCPHQSDRCSRRVRPALYFRRSARRTLTSAASHQGQQRWQRIFNSSTLRSMRHGLRAQATACAISSSAAMNRLLMFTMNDTGDGELHNSAQSVQMWCMLQLLAAKLFETWTMLTERFLQSNPPDVIARA
jgi:hypothetical protein